MMQIFKDVGHRFWRYNCSNVVRKQSSIEPMPSSVIAGYSYNKEDQVLRIVFVSGMVYLYKGVPASIFESFKRSGSKGIYFNQYIKNQYAFERVNE